MLGCLCAQGVDYYRQCRRSLLSFCLPSDTWHLQVIDPPTSIFHSTHADPYPFSLLISHLVPVLPFFCCTDVIRHCSTTACGENPFAPPS